MADPLGDSGAVSGTIRVFHCDDSLPFRVLVREMLVDLGGIEMVGDASDLDEALALLPAAGADVVLVDLFDPDRPGELLARLREASPGSRMLLYTGMPEHHVPEGADGHVHKSVAFADLRRAIAEAAGRP